MNVALLLVHVSFPGSAADLMKRAMVSISGLIQTLNAGGMSTER